MTDDKQNSISFNAYIDRIENGLAVIVIKDGDADQFDFPLDRLPPGTKAGEHLVVNIKLDQESKETSFQRIVKLREELGHTSDSDATGFKI